ncbi:MAG TPA: TolC family protein [Polyangiales bacterium]|nr:TolC family protein [Polyangiales bacterium]
MRAIEFGSCWRRACAGALLVVSSIVTASARADVIALQDLEARALHTRPSLGASDARIAGAMARIDLARAAYSPTLNIVGDASLAPGTQLVKLKSDAIDDPTYTGEYLIGASRQLGQSGAFSPFPRYGLLFDLRGNLYDFGRTSAAVDAARAQRRASEAEAQQSARDIVREVRAAYVRWATAHALWVIARDAARAADERSTRTSETIAEGARPLADKIASQTEAAFSRLELDRAGATLESARMDLGFVCVTDLPESAEPDPAVLDRGEAPKVDDEHDPSLMTLEQQRTAALATARVHDHAFAPILGAQAQAGVQGQGGVVFPMYRVGLNINVPIWDGGSDAAARSASEARAAELAAQATQYKQDRAHQLKKNQIGVAQAERRMDLVKQLLELTHARLSQLEEGYPLGAATLQELADARAAVQRANTEWVLAQATRAESLLGVQ